MNNHQDDAVAKVIMRMAVYVCVWLLVLFLLTAWSPEAAIPEWLFTTGALVAGIVGAYQGISKKGGY